MHSSDAPRPTPPALSPDWALFLDVDGCLLEHAPAPHLSRVPPQLPLRLQAIANELDGALALVSGRSLHSLQHLFPDCAQLCLSGMHGLERRSAHAPVQAPQAPAELAALAQQAQRLASEHPGAVIEAHGPCLNLHWRAAPAAAAAMGEFADAALPRLSGYRLHRGEHGIEIRPAGMDKGRAIDELMALAPFRGRRPVFAGDDPADEPGFAAVNARDGISVLVGERSDSAARHRLADPARVRAWLGVAAEAA
ncbi:trehalose-phosphatase [Lysobacter enzymogenes]|uniref:trehalose-phosphatase n=1 Tax=Lysobacter enzymogenes TaxID=69 RepID=UPI003850AE56